MKPIFIPFNHEYLRIKLNEIAISESYWDEEFDNETDEFDWDGEFDWKDACCNIEDIDFLLDFKENIYWEYLSCNADAVEYLNKNQDKINWNGLGSNRNPKAIALLRQNMDKIITGYCEDGLNLFGNETKEAAELSKEVIHKLKPGEKYSFVANAYCYECPNFAGISRCPRCVRKTWITISKNKYMRFKIIFIKKML